MSPSATRRRSAAALLLLVAFCCIVRDAAAAAGPVITSVSGCVDVGATTVNCSLPVLLTVRGSGFLTGIASAGSFYQGAPIYYINPQPAFSPQAVQAGWVRPYLKAYYGTPCNDTHFVFQLVNLGRGVFLTDTLIGLSVLLSADSLTAGILSEPFLGLSIASLPQPSIASISGCVTAADGLSVSQCLPDLHPLTVMGSGFLAWQLTPLLLVIGTTSSGLTVQLGGDSPRWSSMVNDSCLYISLAVDYRYLVAAGDFGAPPLTFAIKERVTGWSSRTLHIQFDALPLPTYQAIVPFNFYTNLLPSCQWGPNQTTIVNCTAGGSGFRISGHYLYDVVATIGGQPCTLMTYGQQDTLYSSQTTPLYNYEPGVLYDLTFSNPAGSVTVPRFISFSGAPYIVSGACRDPTLPTDIGSLGCQVAETLLLNGPNLPPPSTPFTVTLFSRASQSNVSCANPRYTSATQLACDVLMPGLPAVGGWDAQYVRWSTGQTLTINNRFDAWDDPYAPRITGVSSTGCGGPVNSAERTLSGCMGGEVLTLYGSHFLSEVWSLVIGPVTLDQNFPINYLRLTTTGLGLRVLDDGTALCELPRPADTPLLPYDAPLMMYLWNATTWDRSNALFLTIASSTTPAAASSSSNTAQIAVGAVLGTVGLVAVIAAVFFLLRRRAASRGDRGSRTTGDDNIAERRESSWFQLSEQHA